ncbi:hypothetical protein T05_5347 [Trichinella murrelli]|uniref:Uncharacterized protein n=1 Tax=Trichinella murrelli TaxID=144512 RepID=A0A0V0TC28_9BILA|nr:hypothetical protein T05_5347 [Trichinella murrelli]
MWVVRQVLSYGGESSKGPSQGIPGHIFVGVTPELCRGLTTVTSSADMGDRMFSELGGRFDVKGADLIAVAERTQRRR